MRMLGDIVQRKVAMVPAEYILPVIERYHNATEKDFVSGEYRSKRYHISKDIKTILFCINALDWKPKDSLEGKEVIMPDPQTTNYYPEWYEWKDTLAPLLDWVQDQFYGKGFLNKCMIALMKPGGRIPLHWDQDPSFTVSRRLHIPLVTHPNVDFKIDGESYYLQKHTLYEVNNLRPHTVYNGSNIVRAHLIMDYYHPKNLHNLIYGTDEYDLKTGMRDYWPDISISFSH